MRGPSPPPTKTFSQTSTLCRSGAFSTDTPSILRICQSCEMWWMFPAIWSTILYNIMILLEISMIDCQNLCVYVCLFEFEHNMMRNFNVGLFDSMAIWFTPDNMKRATNMLCHPLLQSSRSLVILLFRKVK